MKKNFLTAALASSSIFTFANDANIMMVDFLDSIVPVIAITCVMALPAIIVLLCLNFKKSKLKYEILEKSIEKGQQLPESIFEEPKKHVDLLGQGLTFITLGIGLAIIFWALTDIRYASIGLLFFLIGVGRIITWIISRKSNNEIPEKN
ncbi:MAG: DUF6249 domain-containing protein [Bacteroidales bacterium]|nr:DUF6249 domain-containing protein [Bacteroidales bacterium]